MPANLTPQYLEAEARFRAAKDVVEKLAALDEMLSLIPKHKGTEKLQADIRRRISRLKSEARKKGKAATRHADPFVVRREGAGQVVLVGPPNAGKSSLVERLTRASPEVALYPFTTRRPVPGMMRFENVSIQLVDAPPITRDYLEPGMATLLRSANLIAFVADLAADDPLAPLEGALSQLETLQLSVSPHPSPSEAEVKRALWVANKSDCPTAKENLELLQELLPRPWIVLSAKTGEGTEELPRRAFEALEVIRIFTKPPGKRPDMDEPTVLGKGATVLDAAAAVHREFAHRLRFVRLWREDGSNTSPSGIKVDRDHVLADGDIIEFHVERTV